MGERLRITQEEDVRKKFRKVGVVVFVFNDEGKVLLLKERTSNEVTEKGAGEYGVVCETSNDNEGWEETVVRAFQEELGMNEKLIGELLGINPNSYFLGEKLFVPGVLARVCQVNWRGRGNEVFQLKGDGEVEIIGWENLNDLSTYPLRRGVNNVLQKCFAEGAFQERGSSEDLIALSVGSLGMALWEGDKNE